MKPRIGPHTFIYNGMNSLDYGLTTSGEDTWTRPKPDVKRIQVPGRNGDLIQLGNRFENVDIKYRCGIIKDLQQNFDAFNARLLKEPGYHRLEDSYHPQHFRMAVFESALDPEVMYKALSGQVEITFNCKPQMFLKSGEQETACTNGAILYNPTDYPSQPIIRFTPSSSSGSGYIAINGVTISFSAVGTAGVTDTVLDCERQDIYTSSTKANRNNYFVLEDGEFFTLAPGRNTVTYSGLSGTPYIKPCWWTV